MGVAFGRRAMGGPAGVTDADRSRQLGAVQRAGQITQLAFGPAAVDVAVHQGGDTGAVIAAVFQPAQRLQDDGRGGTRADDAYDATHSVVSLVSRCPQAMFLRRRSH